MDEERVDICYKEQGRGRISVRATTVNSTSSVVWLPLTPSAPPAYPHILEAEDESNCFIHASRPLHSTTMADEK
ncbi:hypothetical protein E2C01_077021 [Portunus trituberculatus]|uniref:Uncharacterized protein n=1 Tax=Portunus trituberculatus TaxID=210409 RepID=A0A5B7IAB4_PORTR|nr:hypothetical protein [Portunus trituberculatus]